MLSCPTNCIFLDSWLRGISISQLGLRIEINRSLVSRL